MAETDDQVPPSRHLLSADRSEARAPTSAKGDRVEAGDVVGFVEIMKSFHEIRSEEAGVVERFLVENEDLVEAGQDIIALAD